MINLKQNIICFGFADWDNPYRTNQHHLMERLSQNNRILFVESLGLRQPAWQRKDLNRIWRRFKKGLSRVKQINSNLYVYSPLVLPFHKWRFCRLINNLVLKTNLSDLIKKLNFSNPVVWTYIPNAVEYFDYIKGKFLLYHCVDELTANPKIPKTVIAKLEKKLLTKADLVIVTSQVLFEKKKIYNPDNTYYLPNVVDYQHFSRSQNTNLPIPEEMKDISQPIMGFIGAMSDYKVNFELIEFIAGRHPEWSLVLIGSKGEGEKIVDLSKLEKYPNVYILGGKPYRTIPDYLRSFLVCLLPNRINDYTRNMFPMKFFEYLSSGKPVVSTNLPSLSEYKNIIYLADSYEDFEKNICLALKEKDSQIKLKRIKLAQENTWDNRIEQIKKLIKEKLDAKFNNYSHL